MQTIPARLMRAQAEACKNRPEPTTRERQRRAYILEAGRAIFIAHGRHRVTIKDVAVATGLTQISIRNQIADLDHLFAQILAKYLDEILAAVGAIPRNQPDLFARRRAEYFRVTRGMLDIPTPLHFLWMRERFTLPDDELEPLEQARRMIGFMLAGEHWETALHLLDTHHLGEAQIEVMLAALDQAKQPEARPQSVEAESAPEALHPAEPQDAPARNLPAATEPGPAKPPRVPATTGQPAPHPPSNLVWLDSHPPPRASPARIN